MGPTALPRSWCWLRAAPDTPSPADVLQIEAEAHGGSAFLLEHGLGQGRLGRAVYPEHISRALSWGPAATSVPSLPRGWEEKPS